MEVLVPIVIVTIGIGLLLLVLRRRPTVVEPPSHVNAPRGGAPNVLRTDDTLRQVIEELRDAPPSEKRISIVRRTGFSKTDLADIQGSVGDLLEKLAPGLVPVDAPPEADLRFPGSSRVLDSLETKSSPDGIGGLRDVYKTTLATEADSAQVMSWFKEWLLGHGWQPNPSTEAGAESSQEYIRMSEHFRLAVADPAIVAPILAMPIPAGTKTIYEVEYSISRRTQRPPH